MSAIDQAFNESVLRLQGWLQFLERKAAEYQRQMERVRGGQAPASGPAAPEPEAQPDEDPWQ